MTELADQKQLARKAASKQRKEIAAGYDADIYDHVAISFIEDLLPQARTLLGKEDLVISAFLPIGSEIDLRPLMAKLEEISNIQVTLPCVIANDTPLVFRRWKNGDALVKESFGTVAPSPEAQQLYPDLLLVPMLAFDDQGFRLGYGGGFYDRSLEELRQNKKVLAVGAAFAGQKVEAVPHDHLDQPLDFMLTEKMVIRYTREEG